MQGVFVSYRREDSAGHTGRLFDRLSDHFGKNRVFMDISDIEPGVDFVDSIEKALIDCEVLLVVMGRDWSSCVDDAGQRRLDDPNDFIRLETATSLRRNIRVIPVLVQGASMPAADELPEELQGLTRRQAIEVSDTRWDYDTRQLIEALEKILPAATAPVPTPSPTASTPTQAKRRGMVGWKLAVLVVLVLAGAGTAFMLLRQEEPRTVSGSSVEQPVRASRVPNVIGQQVGDAKWQLEKSGFTLGVVQAKRTDKKKAGTVLGQDPEAGVAAKLGAPVALFIAEAPEIRQAKIPGLTGLALEHATELLVKAGFKPGRVTTRETTESPPGTVLEQSPAPGSEHAAGARVDLVIATEPRGLKTPELSGQDAKTGLALLKKLGLEPRIERKMVFSSAENGIILDQKPAAGYSISAGGTVELLVGTLPPVHASGDLELKQTYTVDLDTGRLGVRSGQDLWFHAVTSTERFLEPQNDARMAFLGDKPASRPPGICAQSKLSIARLPINKIQNRSSLCVLTNEGRYAYVQFAVRDGAVGGVLQMKYTTWSTF